VLKLIIKLFGEARGSAVWDAIRWTWDNRSYWSGIVIAYVLMIFGWLKNLPAPYLFLFILLGSAVTYVAVPWLKLLHRKTKNMNSKILEENEQACFLNRKSIKAIALIVLPILGSALYHSFPQVAIAGNDLELRAKTNAPAISSITNNINSPTSQSEISKTPQIQADILNPKNADGKVSPPVAASANSGISIGTVQSSNVTINSIDHSPNSINTIGQSGGTNTIINVGKISRSLNAEQMRSITQKLARSGNRPVRIFLLSHSRDTMTLAGQIKGMLKDAGYTDIEEVGGTLVGFPGGLQVYLPPNPDNALREAVNELFKSIGQQNDILENEWELVFNVGD
jgi:hypothetical protein